MSIHQQTLNALPKRSNCPRCGKPNKCAMEEGKSIYACWCLSENKVELDVDYDGCLCKNCLHELSEES